MKKIYFVILFLINISAFAMQNDLLLKQTICPPGYFCLDLNTPVQSGFLDESYDIILSTTIIFPEGNKDSERNEITINPGDHINIFDPASFQRMTISFIEVTHSPGGNQADDLSQLFHNCVMSYDMEPGMHYIAIYPTNSGFYLCNQWK